MPSHTCTLPYPPVATLLLRPSPWVPTQPAVMPPTALLHISRRPRHRSARPRPKTPADARPADAPPPRLEAAPAPVAAVASGAPARERPPLPQRPCVPPRRPGRRGGGAACGVREGVEGRRLVRSEATARNTGGGTGSGETPPRACRHRRGGGCWMTVRRAPGGWSWPGTRGARPGSALQRRACRRGETP